MSVAVVMVAMLSEIESGLEADFRGKKDECNTLDELLLMVKDAEYAFNDVFLIVTLDGLVLLLDLRIVNEKWLSFEDDLRMVNDDENGLALDFLHV